MLYMSGVLTNEEDSLTFLEHVNETSDILNYFKIKLLHSDHHDLDFSTSVAAPRSSPPAAVSSVVAFDILRARKCATTRS